MKQDTEKRNEGVGSRTLGKGLLLLETFIDAAPEQALSELSQRTGLHKSIVFRLATTLVRHGFLEKDAETRRYRVGLRAFEVGNAFLLERQVEQVALPVMHELVAASGHTSHLGVLHGREVIYTAIVPSPNVLRVSVRTGERRPAHSTAIGKVLLASLPEEMITRLYRGFRFPQLTPHTVRSLSALRRALAEVRQRGFGLNDEESVVGLQAIAAAVHGPNGIPVAAVSIAYPKQLVPSAHIAKLIGLVRESAGAISKRLGAAAGDGGSTKVRGRGGPVEGKRLRAGGIAHR